MSMALYMAVLAKEEVVEGYMVKTHINFPERTAHSW